MRLSQPKWVVTTILLCTYGFLKEFRPTEPFLYQYEHETLNISEHTLNADVYPIWTYSYMLSLIPVFLLTDLLLYKSLIVIEALAYIVVWCLLTFAGSVLAQQILEVFYGIATATEIAYFAYIYVNVSKDKFKRVTSYTRGALLLGRFLGYSLAQMIILMKWGTYETLNIISLVALCIGLIFAIILPSVSWKNAYEKKLISIGTKIEETSAASATYKDFAKLHFKTIIGDIRTIYGNTSMMKWSLWWALTSCAFYQIGNYTQTLWGTIIDVNNSEVYNGVTEALCPLIGLPIVFLVQYIRIDWSRWGELCLAICSLLDAFILLLLSQTGSLLVMYIGYVAYRVLYQAMMTITQFNLADGMEVASYGLVFGLNTFVALVLQSILTFVVASSGGLALSIRPQFEVYSGYHFVVAAIFIVSPLYKISGYIVRKFQNWKKT
ncbi:reduced folate carrier [Oesophagostomum dentatum]|uniref:Reduced folate carrier n=1 Tax=Oesophagostomum dentatum TaxID=61180 RepID=A0A0B1SYT4_OESDE|nr:reduced folate carrier [Oesophagostomum dentatum]